jgi:F0F1-type ATP synthase assembly protein I
MKTTLSDFFKHMGFFSETENEKVFTMSYDHLKYPNTGDKDKITVHRDFLQSLNEKEDKRLESIDAKTTQMIAQTGIIFSLLGIFIPIFLDKASSLHPVFKIILLIFLILACFCHIMTIHNALKNYRINKFAYVIPSAQNVMDFKDAGTEAFLAEEVRDLMHSVAKSEWNNNRKATNLLHSYFTFKIANILTGAIVILFASSMLFYNKEEDTVTITKPVQIQGLDTLSNRIQAAGAKRDTIVILNALPGAKDSSLKVVHKSSEAVKQMK